jgi:dimethylaniline monooxygenase (N-oxide forming)
MAKVRKNVKLYPSTSSGEMATTSQPELNKTICVIGSGAAGLITAHTLLRDGFTNVDVITRDQSAGGVWAAERVYPGLAINK